MLLKPDQNLQKMVLSTPAQFVGEFGHDTVLLTHAWALPSQAPRHGTMRTTLLLAVHTQPDPETPAFLIPDYSHIGEQMAHRMSLLFGKRFDYHGMTEGSGLYRLPDFSTLATLCTPTLPIHSDTVRADWGVPLNLNEVVRLTPLLFDGTLPAAHRQTLDTATKFYAQAVQNFETDPEVAYLHLITAGEILAEAHDYEAEQMLDATTRHYLDRIQSQVPGGDKIAQHFRGRLRSIRRRFVLTLCGLVDDAFFVRKEAQGVYPGLKAAGFRKTMLAAYDLRSKYVHTGQPFGSWVRPRGQTIEEVQVGRPVVTSADLAKTLADAPTLVGLERVLRYALLRFASEHSLISERSTGAISSTLL
jgi:hypothetical protein